MLTKQSTIRRYPDPEDRPIANATEITTDLINRKNDLRANTFEMYRSSLLWFFRGGSVEDPTTEAAIGLLMESRNDRGRPKKEGLHPKSISMEDFDHLQDHLRAKAERSMWADRARHWIRATYACGLRPVEWLDAEWNDNEQVLRVRSSKTKLAAPAFLPGGVTPEQKFRKISPQSPEHAPSIEVHLELLEAFIPKHLSHEERQDKFRVYLETCGRTIGRACQKIWQGKKSYTLYTFRSQFCANAKATHGADIAAALMGHSSADSPSASHYAKGNQAHAAAKGKGALRPSQMPAIVPPTEGADQTESASTGPDASGH